MLSPTVQREKNRDRAFHRCSKGHCPCPFPTKTYKMNKAHRLVNFTRTHSPGRTQPIQHIRAKLGNFTVGSRHSRQELEDQTTCISSNMSSAEPLLQYLIPHGLCQSGTGDTKVLEYINHRRGRNLR